MMMTAAEETYTHLDRRREQVDRDDFRRTLVTCLARIMDEQGTIDRADWSDALESAELMTRGGWPK